MNFFSIFLPWKKKTILQVVYRVWAKNKTEKKGFHLDGLFGMMKNESIQTVNDVMWNKAVFRANDSDVCLQKKRVKSHKRYLCKRKKKKGCLQEKCIYVGYLIETCFLNNLSFSVLFSFFGRIGNTPSICNMDKFWCLQYSGCALNNKMNLKMITANESCLVFSLQDWSSFEFKNNLFSLPKRFFWRNFFFCLVLWFRLPYLYHLSNWTTSNKMT